VRPQSDNRKNTIIALLAETLREILDTLYRKYPGEVLAACAGEGAPETRNLVRLQDLILRYSGDDEIVEILARRFRECERIVDSADGAIPPAHNGQTALFDHLDEGSRAILAALYERRYATLDDLSSITGLPHYDVLHRLREIINPLSVKHRGRPIAVFREVATDLATGRQIGFAWWLNDDSPVKVDAVEVVETADALILTLNRTGGNLPRSVEAHATFRHGLLEIRIEKNTPGGGKHEKDRANP